MLHVEINYQVDDATGRIDLKIEPEVDGLNVTLVCPIVTETRHVPQYQPWSESGFAMVATALAAFSDELTCEDGTFTSAQVRISPGRPKAADGDVKPFCVVTFTCSAISNRLVVDGPVLRMTQPISGLEISDNLYGLLRFLLAACDSWIDKSEPLAEAAPTYARADGSDAFVFISELPDFVQPWFVAHTKWTNPSALQRDGQTATAQAYRAFCEGCS